MHIVPYSLTHKINLYVGEMCDWYNLIAKTLKK